MQASQLTAPGDLQGQQAQHGSGIHTRAHVGTHCSARDSVQISFTVTALSLGSMRFGIALLLGVLACTAGAHDEAEEERTEKRRLLWQPGQVRD